MAGATPFAGINDDHLFFGIGGGLSNFAQNIAYRATTDNIAGEAYVGKMFSSAPVSASKRSTANSALPATTANAI